MPRSQRLTREATRWTAGSSFVGIRPSSPRGPLAVPVVEVAELFDSVVALPAVSDDAGARLHVIGDEAMQRAGRCIRQRPHPAPAKSFWVLDFHGNARQHLLPPRTTAPQPRFLSPDVGFIHLHRAGQPVPAGADQHRPQSVQHRPRGLVGADLQRPLQAQGGDPVLPGREQPARGEPDGQRRARALKDGARRDRGPAAAARAHDAPVAERPALAVAAARTGEALRPPEPVQIVEAIRIGPEPRLELTHRPRIVLSSARLLHTPAYSG